MKLNKKGCKPTYDICAYHDNPLWCKHGCREAIKHKCKELDNPNENEK